MIALSPMLAECNLIPSRSSGRWTLGLACIGFIVSAGCSATRRRSETPAYNPPQTSPPVQVVVSKNTSPNFQDEDGDGVPNGADACMDRGEDWRGPFPADGCPRFVDVRQDLESHLRVNPRRWEFASDFLFTNDDNTALKARAKVLLQAIAEQIAASDKLSVLVYGQTNGGAWYEKLKTDRQAVALLEHLQESGLNDTQLSGAGLGLYCHTPKPMVHVVLSADTPVCEEAQAAGIIRRPLRHKASANDQSP